MSYFIEKNPNDFRDKITPPYPYSLSLVQIYGCNLPITSTHHVIIQFLLSARCAIMTDTIFHTFLKECAFDNVSIESVLHRCVICGKKN